MLRFDPDILVPVLAALLIMGACVARRNLVRRMARFGDMNLAGAAVRRYAWIPGPVLTAAAVGCLAAALAVPERQRTVSEDVVEFALDPGLLGGEAAGDFRSGTAGAVRLLMAQAPGRLYSVSAAGEPVTVLIPETSDADGVFLMLDRLVSGPGYEAVSGQAGRNQPVRGGHRRIVCVVASRSEDGTGAIPGMRDRCAAVLKAASENEPLLFGCRDADGMLRWSASPAAVASMLNSVPQRGPGIIEWMNAMDTVQRLALAAFFLLASEFLWTWFFL